MPKKPFKLFGFEFLKSKEQEKQDLENKSFVPPVFDDGAINIESTGTPGGAFYGQFIDMDGTYRSDNELIGRYRSMSFHPEIDTAIEEITNEVIVTDKLANPVKLIMDDLDLEDTTKQKIISEFNYLLDLLEFQSKGFDYFRRWYIDAKIYFHTIIDESAKAEGIKEIRYVDPLNIKKIREITKEKQEDGTEIIKDIKEYYTYNKDSMDTNNPIVRAPTVQSGVKISPDVIVYVTSGLYDPQKKLVYGYLHKAIRPLNQLRMMEDSAVIYRLSRAPERRIFYIDVGTLPKAKAEQYMRELINKYRNKLMYDANTGEIRDDRRYLSVLEDYWLPRRENGKGTEIDTLPGASNLNQIEDITYFQKKLSKALNLPYSRVENEQKSFQIGRTTEITRDELKFSKFIERLRNKFGTLFQELLQKQLILKGILTPEEWEECKHKIHINFLSDMYFDELKDLEIENERWLSLSAVEPYIGKYYSKQWVRKHILRQNDQDIKDLDKQMSTEKTEEQEELLQQQKDNAENFNDPNNDDSENIDNQEGNEEIPDKNTTKFPFKKNKFPPKV